MRLRSSTRSSSAPPLRSAVQSAVRSVRLALRAPVNWPPVRWAGALGGAVICALAVGLPTAVIPNSFFGREIPTQWWNYPVLVSTALLGGILLATYVRRGAANEGSAAGSGSGPDSGSAADSGEDRRPGRLGTAGGVLTFFAVGCPVCNKLVLLLLGTSGALSVWAPVQPLLAVASLVLLAVATVRRLAGETACAVPAAPAASGGAAA